MSSNTPRVSRRAILHRVALPALVLPAALASHDAAALRTWCKADPVVKIGTQLADIWMSSYVDMLLSATGPIQLVITVPVGVATAPILNDLGFGRGYKVSFQQSSTLRATASNIPFRVSAYAPAKDGTLPVKVEVVPRLLSLNVLSLLKPVSATGRANSWVALTTG